MSKVYAMTMKLEIRADERDIAEDALEHLMERVAEIQGLTLTEEEGLWHVTWEEERSDPQT